VPDELALPDVGAVGDGAVADGAVVAGGALVAVEPLVAVAGELARPGTSCATTPTISATVATAPAVVQRKVRRTRSNASLR
jgi:hypothetical protein